MTMNTPKDPTGGSCPPPPCSADLYMEEVSAKIRRGEPVGIMEALTAIEYQRQRKLQEPQQLWKRLVRFFLPNAEVRGGETPSSVPLGSAYRLVCAAMLMEDGFVVLGVRHFSPDMRAVLHRIYGEGYHLKVKEQGFIDTHGNFLDRKTAWQRCEETQQFHRKVSTDGTLYSENLY